MFQLDLAHISLIMQSTFERMSSRFVNHQKARLKMTALELLIHKLIKSIHSTRHGDRGPGNSVQVIIVSIGGRFPCRILTDWPCPTLKEWGFLQCASPSGVPSLVSRLIDLKYTHMICELAFPDGQFASQFMVFMNFHRQNEMPQKLTFRNGTLTRSTLGAQYHYHQSVRSMGFWTRSFGMLECIDSASSKKMCSECLLIRLYSQAFIDGEFDPWLYATPHAPGAKERKSTLLRPFEVIPGGVHHWDENGLPSEKGKLQKEPDEIAEIHQKEAHVVKRWLELSS